MAKKEDTLTTVAKLGALGVVGFFVLRWLLQADAPRVVVPASSQQAGP